MVRTRPSTAGVHGQSLVRELRSHEPCVHAKSLQSCLTLCDPMDCSPSSSPVHEILQKRILEWVAISSSRASS